jgi:[ribosomal protein S18]-alanine N-acetyltransferase
LTTNKQVESGAVASVPPSLDVTKDFTGLVRFSAPTDEEMQTLANLRSASGPWKDRGETPAESMEALTKLRPYISVGKVDQVVVGYVTVERDGPVPGASYMRNIVVKHELRKKGVGRQLLDQGLKIARDMNRKTLALRVDPANSSAVSFYRANGFTTVATVVSKKSGKLRLLMSREL